MLEGCTPWPKSLESRYVEEGYWQGRALGDLLAWDTSNPAIALVTEDREVSYGELERHIARLVSGFAGLGLEPRDRVVVQMPNVPEFAYVCVALFRLGIVPVLALASQRRNEIEYLCAHSGARAYFVVDEYLGFDYRDLATEVKQRVPSLEHVVVAGDPGPHLALDGLDGTPPALRRMDPREVAFFLLSGGTTALPKLIPRTHDDYTYQLRATARGVGVDARSVYLASLPVAHNAALGCPGLLGTLLAGGRVVLPHSSSPDEVFPLVAREGVTLTTLVPSLVSLWIETHGFFSVNPSGVLLQVGGALLRPEVARKVVEELGWKLTHWFGMAEGLLSFTRLDDPSEVVIGTQGRPLCPADELRVVDEQDRDVPPGEVGQLITRGPYTLRGYYRADEHNAQAFTRDGFLRTGDLVRITSDGNMVVEGRVKDVINRGGEKVSAEELEIHLIAHAGIRDVAVVAMPDDALGEKTCAWLVTDGAPPSLDAVRRFLLERGLAEFKLPDRVETIDAFPLTNFGKVNKAALRREVAARLATPGLAR